MCRTWEGKEGGAKNILLEGHAARLLFQGHSPGGATDARIASNNDVNKQPQRVSRATLNSSSSADSY